MQLIHTIPYGEHSAYLSLHQCLAKSSIGQNLHTGPQILDDLAVVYIIFTIYLLRYPISTYICILYTYIPLYAHTFESVTGLAKIEDMFGSISNDLVGGAHQSQQCGNIEITWGFMFLPR